VLLSSNLRFSESLWQAKKEGERTPKKKLFNFGSKHGKENVALLLLALFVIHRCCDGAIAAAERMTDMQGTTRTLPAVTVQCCVDFAIICNGKESFMIHFYAAYQAAALISTVVVVSRDHCTTAIDFHHQPRHNCVVVHCAKQTSRHK